VCTAAAAGSVTVTVDGVQQESPAIPLADDRRDHNVEVGIGPQSS